MSLTVPKQEEKILVKFAVVQANDSENEFATVQEAFSVGGARVQSVEKLASSAKNVVYPAAYVKDGEGRYYGPILRP